MRAIERNIAQLIPTAQSPFEQCPSKILIVLTLNKSGTTAYHGTMLTMRVPAKARRKGPAVRTRVALQHLADPQTVAITWQSACRGCIEVKHSCMIVVPVESASQTCKNARDMFVQVQCTHN